jgi:hypothetical protein
MTKPLAKSESRKLSFNEADWGHHPNGLVATSRTRGGCRSTEDSSSPSNKTSSSGQSERDEDSAASSGEEEEKETEEEDLDDADKATEKPSNTRFILEVAQLDKIFDELGCPKCGQPLVLNLQTVCIATHIGIECSDKEGCKYFLHPQTPSETTIHWNDAVRDKRERNTDFAVNVLYVLAFIGMGDGPTEAGRLLGLLGLPNDTSMGTRSFGIIKERIAVIIRELCDEIIEENLIAEAKVSMLASTQDSFHFELWKSALTDKTTRQLCCQKARSQGLMPLMIWLGNRRDPTTSTTLCRVMVPWLATLRGK